MNYTFVMHSIYLKQNTFTGVGDQNFIHHKELDQSAYGQLALEVKALMGEREFIPQKLCREQNRVADCLASYSALNVALLFGHKRAIMCRGCLYS